MPILKRAGRPTLHYAVDDFTDPWKNARTVVLQHGFGRSGAFWYSWVPYLSRYFRVVRPDLRGLGRSPVDFEPHGGLSVDAYLEDLFAILDDLGVDAAHVCGESFGGILGMAAAATRPERIRTLSLVSAPVRLNEKHKETFAAGFSSRQEALRTLGAKRWAAMTNDSTRFPPGTDEGLREWYAAEMGKSDVEVLCALYELLRDATAEPYLKRIKAPVLALYPTAGPITDEEQRMLLQRDIANLRFIEVPSRFHSILTLKPALCAQHVLQFASEFDGTPCHE